MGVHIGKLVLKSNVQLPKDEWDNSQWNNQWEPERDRSRSRSADRKAGARSGSPDWSRWRGKSDAQMVEELRGRVREEAVCNDRKDYAKRLPSYESCLCTRREQGSQEARLIEDETHINMEKRRPEKPITQEEEEEFERLKRSRSDAEHERQRKLKDIYEKYTSQKNVQSK